MLNNSALPITTKLREYTITQVLGQGGFGIVYLAQHPLHEKCVIKELFLYKDCLRDSKGFVQPQGVYKDRFDEFQRKFKAEALAIKKLHEPLSLQGVVKVIDYFSENGTAYFVMPFIEGETLEQYLEKQINSRISQSETISYLRQICQTLSKVHKQNVFHCDLKPANILINPEGEITLIDFGIAHQYAGLAETENTAMTPNDTDAAFEQFVKKDIARSLDIYGLGTIAYKCLTGVVIINALSRQKKDNLIPPRLINSDLTILGESIIQKCLSLKVENRYAAVEELLMDLEKWEKELTTSMFKPLPLRKIGVMVAFIFFVLAGIWGGYELYCGNTDTDKTVKTEIEKGLKCYNEGQYETSFSLLHKHQDTDSFPSEAQVDLGAMYELGKGVEIDSVKAAEWYRKAAEKEDMKGQFNLGRMYRNGIGVTKDEKQTAIWYEKSAKQGYAEAQVNLGTLYRIGKGVRQDMSEAISWYQKAANQQDPSGQSSLGTMYEYGFGVDSDLNKARQMYEKSAAQKDPHGQYLLGRMYENGKGGLQENYAKALELYKKSAAQEDTYGLFALGQMYATGKSVARNREKALEYGKKSANKGNAEAQNFVGWLYEKNGDYANAVIWYQKSEKQGNAQAQNHLGEMYEGGRGGLSTNKTEALILYRLSAEQGNKEARANLKRLEGSK